MTKNAPRAIAAKLAWIVIVPGLMLAGILMGAWIPPILAAWFADGDYGIRDIGISYWTVPGAPKWWDQQGDRKEIGMLAISGMIVGWFFAAFFGWLGLRMTHYIFVTKLLWVSEAEVKKSNEGQWM